MTQILTETVRRYFTKSCKIFTTFSTNVNTDGNRLSVFYQELQSIYCICHNYRRPYQRFVTIGIQQRVEKYLLPMPQPLTLFSTDAANSNACDCQSARSVSTDTNDITNKRCKFQCTCFDTFILMDVLTDFENFEGIFKILVRNSKYTDENYRWKFNATAFKLLF